MKTKIVLIALLTSLVWLEGCKKPEDNPTPTPPVETEKPFPYPIKLVDEKATYETKALFYNLKELSGKGILFGQQDATLMGVGWKGDADRSDIKSVTGEHPAVYGWDFWEIVRTYLGYANTNAQDPLMIKKATIAAYDRGGVNTFCWHMQNFVTGKDFYDTTASVKAILPGGEKHEIYKRSLNIIADYVKDLKGSDGKQIPVIFRPFHEHTGGWFWWGKGHTTKADFIQLWQFTVKYLRDTKEVRTLLFAYSPDRVEKDFAEYLDWYPGDEYVDILGMDNYWDFRDSLSADWGAKNLAQVVRTAREKGKVAALTETGLAKVAIPNWYTNILLKNIKKYPDAQGISYMVTWTNRNTDGFYSPYPGQAAVPDFIKFYNDPLMRFQSKTPPMYSVK